MIFMDSFIETGCLSALTKLMNFIQSDKSVDFTMTLAILSAISSTFTRMEHVHEDAVEFMQAVNTFVFSEKSSIISKIASLPAAQIKDLKEDEILNVIKAYYDISGDTQGKEVYCAKAQLNLLVTFLQLPFLEKKLIALNEIKMFDKKFRSKEIPPKTLAKWLYECNIIDYIYKEAKHPELISRSTDLL